MSLLDRCKVDAWTPGRLDAWTPGRLDAWTPGRNDEAYPHELPTLARVLADLVAGEPGPRRLVEGLTA